LRNIELDVNRGEEMWKMRGLEMIVSVQKEIELFKKKGGIIA
jgi:hypothetical protein